MAGFTPRDVKPITGDVELDAAIAAALAPETPTIDAAIEARHRTPSIDAAIAERRRPPRPFPRSDPLGQYTSDAGTSLAASSSHGGDYAAAVASGGGADRDDDDATKLLDWLSDSSAAARADQTLSPESVTSKTARASARNRVSAVRAAENLGVRAAALTSGGAWLEPTSSELAAVLESARSVERQAKAMETTTAAQRVRYAELADSSIASSSSAATFASSSASAVSAPPPTPSRYDHDVANAAKIATTAVEIAEGGGGGLSTQVEASAAFVRMDEAVTSLAGVATAASAAPASSPAAPFDLRRSAHAGGGSEGGASYQVRLLGGVAGSGGETYASRRARLFLSSAPPNAAEDKPSLEPEVRAELARLSSEHVYDSDAAAFGGEKSGEEGGGEGGGGGAGGASPPPPPLAVPAVDPQAALASAGAAPSGFKGSSMVWAALAQANAVASQMTEQDNSIIAELS